MEFKLWHVSCFLTGLILPSKNTKGVTQGYGMEKILISWIGATDTKNAGATHIEPGMGGPVHTILESRKFDQIHLLHTTDEKTTLGVQAIRNNLANFGRCTFVPTDVNPVDPSDVYAKTLAYIQSMGVENTALYYNLTSGTPAIYAALLLLGACTYPGTVLRAIAKDYVDETGKQVFEVALPFTIALLGRDEEFTGELFIAEANQRVFAQARTVAPYPVSVLIQGESGVGKTWLAKYIHKHSQRRKKNFVELNCAEIAGRHDLMRSELFGHKKGSYTGATTDSEGAFERAHEGTLFLDEIGEIPLDLQGMLLRALDQSKVRRLGDSKDRGVDVRIIAATNKNLLDAVRKGAFREDLYYRLAQYTPVLRPVREYSDADRERLLDVVLKDVNARYFSALPRVLAQEARDLLLAQQWLGNIREMNHRLTSICLLAEAKVTAGDVREQLPVPVAMEAYGIPAYIPDGFNLNQWLDDRSREIITLASTQVRGKKKEMARLLGMPAGTLTSRMKVLGQGDED